jgi:hypothetical protein
MKTQNHAINYIFSILTDWNGIGVPVYKYTKPTTLTPDEFIVINALPISAGILQKVIVNVNYYVKDLGSGLPDIDKLECKTSGLMTLTQEISAVGYMVDFETQEYHRESQINYHYSNIRLSIKLIN